MLLFSYLTSPREKRNESTCVHHTQATVGGKNAAKIFVQFVYVITGKKFPENCLYVTPVELRAKMDWSVNAVPIRGLPGSSGILKTAETTCSHD